MGQGFTGDTERLDTQPDHPECIWRHVFVFTQPTEQRILPVVQVDRRQPETWTRNRMMAGDGFEITDDMDGSILVVAKGALSHVLIAKVPWDMYVESKRRMQEEERG